MTVPANKPDVIQVSAKSSCQCDGNTKCSCPTWDMLIFTVNGLTGFGDGTLVQTLETPAREIFDCKFMGWQFEARNRYDAARKIKAHFSALKNITVECH